MAELQSYFDQPWSSIPEPNTPNGQIETIEQSGPNAATKFVKYTYNQSGLTTQIERTEQPPPSGNPPTNTSPVPVATTKIGYPALSHNIQHFCVRELGTSSRAYLASADQGNLWACIWSKLLPGTMLTTCDDGLKVVLQEIPPKQLHAAFAGSWIDQRNRSVFEPFRRGSQF